VFAFGASPGHVGQAAERAAQTVHGLGQLGRHEPQVTRKGQAEDREARERHEEARCKGCAVLAAGQRSRRVKRFDDVLQGGDGQSFDAGRTLMAS